MSTFPAAPFPGLRPFTSQEAEIFFGRELDVDRSVRTLSLHGLVAIAGRSGGGKSSLVQAGIVPALHGFLEPDGRTDNRPILMRPGNDPIRELAHALILANQQQNECTPQASEACEARLRASTSSLLEIMATDPRPRALIVDNFEEVFSEADERGSNADFIRLLLSAANPAKCHANIVLVIGAESLSEVERFPELCEALTSSLLLLPRLTPSQVSDAIARPLEKVGARIEAELIERVIHDVSGLTDELSRIQHAMKTCWEYAKSEALNGQVTISRYHYEAVGGVVGAIDFSAEETFAQLSPEEQQISERMFRALATRDEHGYFSRRPLTIARVAHVAGVPTERILKLATSYSEKGFLSPPVFWALSEETVIDVSQEAVLRSWRRMTRWIDDEHRMAEDYRTYVYMATEAQQGHVELARTGPGRELAIAFRENPILSKGWASQYGSEADYEAVVHFLSASLETSTGAPYGGAPLIRRKIFICYRRDDSSHPADRIFEGLKREFPKDQIFYDVQSIPGGIDFSVFIHDRIRECAVLLAVIGDHWVRARFEDGPREGELRIDDPADFVRVEIETALREDIRVIPVLVGTRPKVPAKSELPPSLQALTSRQAFELSPGSDFNVHLERLLAQVKEIIPADNVTHKVSSWLLSLITTRRN